MSQPGSHQKAQTRIVEAALKRHQAGDFQHAHDVYHQVLSQNPHHPQALHYLGLMAQQHGQSQEALKLINQSIEHLPTDPRAYNHIAQIYMSMDKNDKARIFFKRALKCDPNHVDTLNNLANLLSNEEEHTEAIALYRRVTELNPTVSHSPYNLAEALKVVRQYEEAFVWYKKTIAIKPDHFEACYGAGLVCEELGDFDLAVEFYESALAIEPAHVRSLGNLLAIKSFRPDKSLVERAEKTLSSVELKPKDIAKLHNGLGKHYDREEEYDRAFAHFDKSCSAQKETTEPHDVEYVSNFCRRMSEAYGEDHFKRVEEWGATKEPIFIVGMMRSGTTLTEQILASHRDVFGAGELSAMPKLSQSYAGKLHNDLKKLTQGKITEAVSDYLGYISDIQEGDAPRFTDKLPLNFMYLGFIATLFPKAKIIHCQRNPFDVGLSSFVEMFSLINDFSLDLEHFAQYYLDYDRLMRHWNKVLPQNIFSLKYEDLIADQEYHSRALLDYVGLGWDENCLSFHQTERAINTPSRWQVRQPIYKSSKERWRNYKSHLAPLIKYLDDRGYKYGDG